MTLELARAHAVPKPWGRADLRPWSALGSKDAPIGEIWFDRVDADAPEPGLLLKLLFTDEPLSIQVHPDDAQARAAGLARGKTEAWYVLSARAHAGVAAGLTRSLSTSKLRAAIDDGSIVSLVQWRRVRPGDVVSIPAGMIHAIGAGLVLAEIQQRSDTTFRLFDHGRARELHAASAVAAADTSLHAHPSPPTMLAEGRAGLVVNEHFVLERLTLPAGSAWTLDAACETWLLVIEGKARLGHIDATVGEAVFAEQAQASLIAGDNGLTALLAYPGPHPRPGLLRRAWDGHAASPSGAQAASHAQVQQ